MDAKVFVLGLEPRTVCVLDRRDNQLHHTNLLVAIVLSQNNLSSQPVIQDAMLGSGSRLSAPTALVFLLG